MNAPPANGPTGQELTGGGISGGWQVEIVTPDGERLQPKATLVELVTSDGEIGVMPGHERVFTVLEVGELVVHNGKQRDVYLIGGGFARILPERLSVLAFSIERTSDEPARLRCEARRKEMENGATSTETAVKIISD